MSHSLQKLCGRLLAPLGLIVTCGLTTIAVAQPAAPAPATKQASPALSAQPQPTAAAAIATPQPAAPAAAPVAAPAASTPAPAQSAPEPSAAPTQGAAEATTPASSPATVEAAPAAALTVDVPAVKLEQPSAITLTPVGSFVSRFEAREKYSRIGLADSDQVRYRARFGLQTSPIDIGNGLHLVVRFVPQASGSWGIGGDTLDDAALGLHEGLVQLHGESYRLDAGRFEMNYGDALVIGNVDWSVTGRSFDGLRLHLTPGDKGLWVDGFATLLKEGVVSLPATATAPAVVGHNQPFATDDLYFTGVYAGLGSLVAEKLDLDVYLLGKIAPRSHDATGARLGAATRYTLGARIKQRVDIVDYRAELGVQVGAKPNDVSVFAYQLDAEVGVNVADDKLRIAGEGLLASGDDPKSKKDEGWDQLYPTAHKWLGYMDIIGPRTNIAGGALHASYAVAQDWKLGVDARFFTRPQDVAAGGVVVTKAGYAATEIDTGISYAIGKGLKLRGAYDLFLPNKDRYGSTHSVHFVETELRYDF